jgi:serine/threonine protein kinase
MEHGSLYDLLHNETMVIEGELLLPILRDISQGVRFLHAAVPQVIHGDLKAQNILVDSRFRAKVRPTKLWFGIHRLDEEHVQLVSLPHLQCLTYVCDLSLSPRFLRRLPTLDCRRRKIWVERVLHFGAL